MMPILRSPISVPAFKFRPTGLIVVLCLFILLSGCTSEPPPPAPTTPSTTVRMVHGPELRSLLTSRRESFYLTNPKLADGSDVKVEFISEMGPIAAELLARGDIKGEGWIAPSTALVNFVNASLKNLGAPQRECIPLFSTPLVVATRPATLDTFQAVGQEFSWNELIQREMHLRGSDTPALARVSFSHATPRLSTTGLDALVQLAYFSVPTEEQVVNLDWLNQDHTQLLLRRHESFVSDYSVSESSLLNRVIKPETARVRFTLTTEQQIVQFNATQVTQPEKLTILYPREGSYWQDYQICTSSADWTTPAHRAAIQMFADFLLTQDSQVAIATSGFRPVKTEAAKVLETNSAVRLNLPSKTLPPVAGEVIAQLNKSWPDLRRPAALAVVLDASGSMEGSPIDGAKHEIRNLVARMSQRDKKALVSFSSQPKLESGFIEDSAAFIPLLDRLHAVGGSAVYDAIRMGVELITSSPLQEYRKALLIVTDGDDKNSQSNLNSLLDFVQDKFSRTDISLVVVGIAGEGRNYNDLKEVVRVANGTFREGSPSELPRLFADLSSNVQGLGS